MFHLLTVFYVFLKLPLLTILNLLTALTEDVLLLAVLFLQLTALAFQELRC